MAKKQADNYQLNRFSEDKLVEVHASLASYAYAIGGMPQCAAEALEKRGWLLPFLFSYDDLLWGRWNYWLSIIEANTIKGSEPIPQIEWSAWKTTKVDAAYKMLNKCLDHHDSRLEAFAEWLLWGLAATNKVPTISESLNEYYYRTFDMFLLQDAPFDYFSLLLADHTGNGYKGALGYFPTPMSLTLLMAQITFGNEDPEVQKRQTVHDPCVGCGVMLLAASNYCLRGYAQDVSYIAIAFTRVQMYLYAPWYAATKDNLEGFEEVEPKSFVGLPENITEIEQLSLV